MDEFIRTFRNLSRSAAVDGSSPTKPDIPSHKSISISPRLSQRCFLTAVVTLEKLKTVDPQYEMSGMRGIWILKPSHLCCGNGIVISHNHKDILRKVDEKAKDYYIVQKYIGTNDTFLHSIHLLGRETVCTSYFRTAPVSERHEIRHKTVVSGDVYLSSHDMAVQVRFTSH